MTKSVSSGDDWLEKSLLYEAKEVWAGISMAPKAIRFSVLIPSV
jgi:hypothetical protein